MKKILSLMAIAMIVAFSSCNNDDDENNITCSFKGMLTEPNSEYLSNESNGTDTNNEFGSVYTSTFTDNTKTFVFDNYSADWVGSGKYSLSGGFTYTNKTDITTTNSIAAITGKGVNGDTYVTAFIDGMNQHAIKFANNASHKLKSAYFTNTTYSYLSMKNGDNNTKQFTADDWFKLTITGSLTDKETGKVDFYLAKDGTIINTWTLVDLSALGTVDKITFSLSSSDNGEWGMNTPAYFSMDQLTIEL